MHAVSNSRKGAMKIYRYETTVRTLRESYTIDCVVCGKVGSGSGRDDFSAFL